ncbi:MAG TPA: DUF3054 domain-containing protein [Anaerolineales bacterium]|nr:DUF3054 domain-containing protein [Anaerolineales bacterium]
MFKQNHILIAGDILAIAILTLIGFASHEELAVSFIPRMGATFFPVAISWFVIAPWFGLFQNDYQSKVRLHWRIAIAALYASTMAAALRGLILGTDIPPVFIVALGAATALGMVIWRWLYSRINREQ